MIKFSCSLKGCGWIKALLSNGKTQEYITASYLTDALEDFLASVIVIVQGANSSSCKWQEEPGEFRFIFTREDQNVTLKVLKFKDSFSGEEDAKGEIIFEGTESVCRFAKNIKQQFDRLLYEYGEGGYRTNWKHEFPTRCLEKLDDAIRATW